MPLMLASKEIAFNDIKEAMWKQYDVLIAYGLFLKSPEGIC